MVFMHSCAIMRVCVYVCTSKMQGKDENENEVDDENE